MIKKILSIILSVAVVLTMMPAMGAATFAETQEDYLTFTSSGDTTVSFFNWPYGMDMQYSKNNGNWIDADETTSIDLNDGDTVKFKGNSGDIFSKTNYLNFYMSGSGTIAASGSVMSLFANKTKCSPYCCYNMFKGCTKLTCAPELPATTLAELCYYAMFGFCENLTEAPELPATRLASECYGSMFIYCMSLTEAPELPATYLPDGCYAYMFKECSKLTCVPELPATTLANECYISMFQNCTALTDAPYLPATYLPDGCYAYMFKGCRRLMIAEDPLEYECCSKFIIPAEYVGEDSLCDMFNGTGCGFTNDPAINTTYYLLHDAHDLTRISAKKATFTSDGNIECWECTTCGKVYADADATTEIDPVVPQIDETSLALSQTEFVFDGTEKKPTVSVSDIKGTPLVADTEFTATYSDNIDTGSGSVTVQFIGKYDGKAEKSFTIKCDHSYGTPKYLWTDDLSECLAYRICTKGCGADEHEAVVTEKDGNTMKASFNNTAFETQTKAIPEPAHEHTFASDWSKNSEYHWHAATCEHKDVTSGHAKHNYNAGTISKGIKTYTCQTCGYQKTEKLSVTVPKTSIKSVKRAKKAFTVKWTKKSVTGYQIQYARNSKFTKSTKTVTVKSASTVSKKIKSLKKKKRYYVRVRCYINKYDTTYYSGWSSRKSVRTR